MRVPSPPKLVVALASALALLAVLASPASAVSVDMEVGGGTLVVAGNTFDLTPGPGGGEESPCADNPNTLALNTDTPSAGRWTVTGGFSVSFRLGTPPAGPWYKADIIINGSGTYSGSAPTYTLATASPNHLTFQVRLYEVGVGDCAKDASNLKCIVAGRAVSTSGTFSGTLPSPSVGDSATVSGSTNVAGGLALVTSSCSAPFVSWNGQHATLTGLVLNVV